MFTGIIETTAIVESLKIGKASAQLAIAARAAWRNLKTGDSVAVNGCCLTAIKAGKLIQFDLLRETIDRTNFQFLKSGALVNLERPLRADGRLDGHFVTGHIDGTGRIVRLDRKGSDHLLDIEAPSELMRHVVQKGSIAIDGISLTVAEVEQKTFRVWIIPHTFKTTNVRARGVGGVVNLETDLLGKYVERFVRNRPPDRRRI